MSRRTSRRAPRAARPTAERLEDREVPAVVGGLDPSFGLNGQVITNFGGVDLGAGVARQPDGKIVAVGQGGVGNDFAVARYNPDGSLDTTFGGDGLATFDLGGTDVATSVAVQPDGKIVVAGYTSAGGTNDFAVIRVQPDGNSLDPTFDADGKRTVGFGGDDRANAVALRPDGRILLAGSWDGGQADFALAQLTPAGALDPTFGGGSFGAGSGRFNLTFGAGAFGKAEFATAVAIQPADGRIVVAGYTDNNVAGGPNNFAVARVLADGTGLDPTFDADGKQQVDFGNDDRANAVVLRPDGRILLAGSWDGGQADFALAQLTPAGALDPTFGGGSFGAGSGRFNLTFGTGAFGKAEFATAVALQPDGKIVVGGYTDNNVPGGPNNFAVARVLANGSALDATFDGDGKAQVDFGGDDDAAGLVLDPAGRVVVVGTTAGANFAAARLIGSVEQARELAVGGSQDGRANVYTPAATGLFTAPAGATVAAFGATTVNARAAVADVNGDGVEDTVLITGPGAPVRFAVVDGRDNSSLLVPVTAPFAGSEDFDGGGFVSAGDLDNDGRAEMVFSPDQGGGPRVTIFSFGSSTPRANFLGITGDPNFRGGARTAVGDVNGDGFADLAVAAGFLGGPRTALFDGRTVLSTQAKLVNDFFSFPDDAQTLRNGAFVAVGDVNGDGFGDLIFGGGPGGAPRLIVFSGALVAAGNAVGAYATPVANFFVAGDANDRGGVRVAAADTDGDNKAEVVAGSGANRASRVRAYLGKNFTSASEPATFQDLDTFGGAVLADGVYVG